MSPNLSIERTSSGRLRLPTPAAHVERQTPVRKSRYFLAALVLGAAIPVLAYVASAALPVFPRALRALAVFLCPSYPFFAATAACEPYDVCSLEMLALVAGVNVALYGALAAFFVYTRQIRVVSYTLLCIAALLSAWWVEFWFPLDSWRQLLPGPQHLSLRHWFEHANFLLDTEA